MNNDQTFAALEAVGFAFGGAAIAAVGEALITGQTDWRVILGAALLAGLAKVFPTQMAAPNVKVPAPAPAPVAPAQPQSQPPMAAPSGEQPHG